MRTQKSSAKISLAAGLLFALGSCVTPSTPLPEESAEGVSTQSLTTEMSNLAACEAISKASKPEPLNKALSDNEETPIFELFNFRPQEIAIAGDSVTITTAHHIFSLCQTNNTWAITAADASADEEPYDYQKDLQKIADPDYETIEVDGETYQYRIRLQAEWLTEQLSPITFDPESPEQATAEELATAEEDAVFFEIKKPDGEVISQQVYTLSELQEAQLGASLGVPSIAGAVSVASDLWFASSASQGEGDSGFASLIHYSPEDDKIVVDKPEDIQGDQITSLVATVGEISVGEISVKSAAADTSTAEASTDDAEDKETTQSTDGATDEVTGEATGDDAEKETAEKETAETENAPENAAPEAVTSDSAPEEDTTETVATEEATGETASEPTADETVAEATGENEPLTLWLGTQRSGEGVPYFPANGLVAYQPETKELTSHTITNSPLIGAIPYQLAVEEDTLWVGTGEGPCQGNWKTIGNSDSWNCWQFTAIATLPSDGVEVFDSFLADGPTATLNKDRVEVLWANQSLEEENKEAAADTLRYEVVYEPGFETQLSQGGYRIENEVAQRAAGGNEIFWPGNQWHWNGKRFERTLDEVALNLVGGGPYGLAKSNSRSGFDFDSSAIRGEFDLLELNADYTKVRYYSGWIEGADIEVYPTVVPAEEPTESKPNPLTEMAAGLTANQGP